MKQQKSNRRAENAQNIYLIKQQK